MKYKKSKKKKKKEEEYHIKNEFWSIMKMIYRLEKRIDENTYMNHISILWSCTIIYKFIIYYSHRFQNYRFQETRLIVIYYDDN